MRSLLRLFLIICSISFVFGCGGASSSSSGVSNSSLVVPSQISIVTAN
jgi:hypothetical protein